MNEQKPEGFQPAPWEAGKPSPPPQPQGYPPPPMGAPQGQAGPQNYQAPPQGAGQAYPPQQGYAQPQAGGAQQGYPPQQGYAQPQPGAYGQPGGTAIYPTGKPTSTLAIVSLVLMGVGVLIGFVSVGIFSVPLFLIGSVLGYLGMRETAAWGKKSGRGIALGGTISNMVLMVLNVVFLLAGFLFIQSVGDSFEQQANAMGDGLKISMRVGMYKEAKGDLKPGGPQFKAGFQNDTAVTGPSLQVTDLVTASELENPIEQYSMDVKDDVATIYWTGPDGVRAEVGRYDSNATFDDDWADFEDPMPNRNPRRH